MFLKTAGFKRILKEACKGRGLHIGATENTVYLYGSYWEIEVKKSEIPKEKLAAIIELSGFIPDPGEQYLVDKYNAQMELCEMEKHNIIQTAQHASIVLDMARVKISGSEDDLRVLQMHGSGQIVLIKEPFIQMIDDYEVNDQAGHSPVQGPFAGAGWAKDIVYFYNNIMALSIMPVRVNGEAGEQLIAHLSKFDFSKRNYNGIDVSENDEEEAEEES